MDSVDADQLRSTKHAVILNIKSKPSFTGKTSLSQAVSTPWLFLAGRMSCPCPGQVTQTVGQSLAK